MAFSNHSPHHNHSPHNICYFSKSEAAIAKILKGAHSVESATHYSPTLCVIYRQNRQNNVQHFVCPYHWLKKNLAIYFSLTSVVSKIQHCVSLLAIKKKETERNRASIEEAFKQPEVTVINRRNMKRFQYNDGHEVVWNWPFYIKNCTI